VVSDKEFYKFAGFVVSDMEFYKFSGFVVSDKEFYKFKLFKGNSKLSAFEFIFFYFSYIFYFNTFVDYIIFASRGADSVLDIPGI